MPGAYVVDVFYNQLEDVYRLGGPGGRWLERVGRDMFTTALAFCPVRDGALKASHRIFYRGVNQYVATYEIFADARHAEWVHEGTNGPIRPNGKWLVIPPGNGFSKKRLKKVSGQAANPWLDEACTEVAHAFGAFGF